MNIRRLPVYDTDWRADHSHLIKPGWRAGIKRRLRRRERSASYDVITDGLDDFEDEREYQDWFDCFDWYSVECELGQPENWGVLGEFAPVSGTLRATLDERWKRSDGFHRLGAAAPRTSEEDL